MRASAECHNYVHNLESPVFAATTIGENRSMGSPGAGGDGAEAAEDSGNSRTVHKLLERARYQAAPPWIFGAGALGGLLASATGGVPVWVGVVAGAGVMFLLVSLAYAANG